MSNDHPLTTDDLVRTLFGSSAFQVLNAGCQLGLFSLLNQRPDSDTAFITKKLSLEPRPTQMLLLGTTALGLTTCNGDRYRNAELLETMFRDHSWDIIEDLVAFESHIVHPISVDFVESLRRNTNVGLRRLEGNGTDLYHRLATNPDLQALFYRCMRSWSRLSNPILIEKADLTGVRRVLDVGGGDGVNSSALAKSNPHVEFTIFDLPDVTEIARRKIAKQGLSGQISVHEGDIFTDPYPTGHDCVLFANQLVIWSPEENLALLGKAWRLLPDGGQVLIFSAISDDSGDGPLYAALDNVYFATLPATHSMIYHWQQYENWLTEVGFSKIKRLPGDRWTPHGVISARK
jgi:ubiquinone/menaquinone biosynthesis C-methylase UbiE